MLRSWFLFGGNGRFIGNGMIKCMFKNKNKSRIGRVVDGLWGRRN